MAEEIYDEEWQRSMYEKAMSPQKRFLLNKAFIIPHVVDLSLENKVQNLTERVATLEEQMRQSRSMNAKQRWTSRTVSQTAKRADMVYQKFRQQLESEHFGKIVALDSEEGTVVAIGDTVLDAYNEAKKRSRKERFSFRKIGSRVFCKIR